MQYGDAAVSAIRLDENEVLKRTYNLMSLSRRRVRFRIALIIGIKLYGEGFMHKNKQKFHATVVHRTTQIFKIKMKNRRKQNLSFSRYESDTIPFQWHFFYY